MNRRSALLIALFLVVGFALTSTAQAAPPKDLSDKLPTDVGKLLKSGGPGLPGLGGAPRFPGLPGLGGGFVPKKK